MAHQSSLSDNGLKVRWPLTSVPLAIQTNTSDLTSSITKNIILSSINEWNNVSTTKVSVTNSSSNQIVFSTDFSIYGTGVLGVTQLNYNSAGIIQAATIFLNDNYTFSSTPGFYSGSQVYLGDVVTHELGHFFGLSHSEVLDSSMFYSSFSGQYSVAPDDIAGIRHKYNSGYGVISGYMKGGSDIGVLGVHVQVISSKTGKAIGAISGEDGYFEIGGLNLDDTYYLYSSPIRNSDSLPSYYSTTQNEFCPASYVGSFFSDCGIENDGLPRPIVLSAAQSRVDLGDVTINCSLRTNQDYNYQKLQTTFSPITIWEYDVAEGITEKAFVGYFLSSTSTSWSTDEVFDIDLTSYPSSTGNKYFKVNLVSYPFGDKLEYELDVEKNGVLVSHETRSYSYVTQTYNPDLEASLPLDTIAANNNFRIKIRAKKLSNTLTAQTFPSSAIFSTSSHLPYLLTLGVWQMSSGDYTSLNIAEVNLSDNSSCLDAPYTYAVSKGKDLGGTSVDAAAASPACATIGPPDQTGGGGNLPILSLGFLLAMLLGITVKSRKNILS